MDGRGAPGVYVSRQNLEEREAGRDRMKWIFTLGLLLPALAAIIGVVAWAVSAEVVMGARRESLKSHPTYSQHPNSQHHHLNKPHYMNVSSSPPPPPSPCHVTHS